MTRAARRRRRGFSRARRIARIAAATILAVLVAWSVAGVWYVHHPRPWLDARRAQWPVFVTTPLLWVGEPLGDLTDGLGLTGEDAVCATDRPAPSGETLFAGAPVRRGPPAPDDLETIDRGDFIVCWSKRLRHPVWCAYHVPVASRFDVGRRPGFRIDRDADGSPKGTDYARSGYDRGHLAPNYAVASRFGPEAQKDTFLMSNIAPQSPSLNRGVWRDIEHRIAELWTAKWGEVWVIVGCLSEGKETLSGTDIDVPTRFWQLVVAQRGSEVRALAFLVEQEVPWRAYPARYLVTIDELEELTGFDFLAELEDGFEDRLESALPSRVWPVRFTDIAAQLRLHSQPRAYGPSK